MKARLIHINGGFKGFIPDEATYEGIKSGRLTFKKPLEEVPQFIISGQTFLRLMALDKENGTFDRTRFAEAWLNPIGFENNPTPSKIAHYILAMEQAGSKDFTYIILGQSGPTGKTWLTKALLDNGFKAFEITEDICNLVDYRDTKKNHCHIDNDKKQVTIVLNARLNDEVTSE